MPVRPGTLPTTPPAIWADVMTAGNAAAAELVAQGLSNKVIARRLWVSEQTVKWHVTQALRATETTNRTELTSWWLSRLDGAAAPRLADAEALVRHMARYMPLGARYRLCPAETALLDRIVADA